MLPFDHTDVALYMADELLLYGFLVQADVAAEIDHYFDPRYAPVTERGGRSIDKDVLKVFHEITPAKRWVGAGKYWQLEDPEDRNRGAVILRAAGLMTACFRSQGNVLSYADAAGLVHGECGEAVTASSPDGSLRIAPTVQAAFGALNPGVYWNERSRTWHGRPLQR